MKKLYFLFTFLIATLTYGQDLVITGAFDGPLPGGTPKLVEIYVANDIADLSLYGFGSANNGGGTDDQELAFAGSATAGQFIYVGFEGSGGSANPGAINQYFGITADYIDSSAGINGDDALEIFFNGAVIDTFGDINTDGNGEPWEYLDGWAYRVDGTGPDGSAFVLSSWTFSGPNAVDGCDLDDDTGTNAGCGSVFPIGTYSPTGSTNPSLTITDPSNNAELAPGTTSVDVSILVQNFVVGNPGGGIDGHIHWTVNGVDQPMKYNTDPETVPVADGESYTVFMQLVDNSHQPINPAVNATVDFSVLSATPVANIAALRAGTIGNVYQLTDEVLITYLTGFRNQKHIEDATGGILIDDSSGTISSPYELADGITGLVGTLGEFNDTMQFVPLVDPGAASSTGNSLPFQTVTLAALDANPEDYESELVRVIGVSFDNTETNFNNGLEIEMTQSGDMFNFRTAFNEDYSDGIIPTTPADVTGVILDRSGNYFLMARYASDFSVNVLSVEGFETTKFSVYPNPTNTGNVTISSANTGAISVSVFDILGKQVKSETLANQSLSVSDLRSGVYIVKISQNDATVTKKLVIK